MRYSKYWIRRLTRPAVALFLLMNVVAAFHAWRFTHFSEATGDRPGRPEEMSVFDKIETLALGVRSPRPRNQGEPDVPFETVVIDGEIRTEAWWIPAAAARGTVVCFHGYGGSRSTLLRHGSLLHAMGHHVMLVDFMGAGGSAGRRTTVGYLESRQVKSCFEYARARGSGPLVLLGWSMGAASITKAMYDHNLSPEGVILECPFGSLYQAVEGRFRAMGIPAFPMAGLLTFWGGTLNGFWAFGFQPEKYAASIRMPALVLHGARDQRVSRGEIDRIYSNLGGPKTLRVYPLAGHENLLTKHQDEWLADVRTFLASLPSSVEQR